MSRQRKTYLAPAQYLEIERRAETKSEYLRGEIFAMVGASREHNLIAMNIAGSLWQQLKSKDCEVYCNDMRVWAVASGLYTYPDVVVVCGKPSFEDDYVDTLLNPIVVVEVLSPSTAGYDRGAKAGYYRSIESLAEIVLVAQDAYRIEQYGRQPDGRWLITDFISLDATVKLASIPCVLPLREVYDKVAPPDPVAPE